VRRVGAVDAPVGAGLHPHEQCDPVAAERLRPPGGRDLAPVGVRSVVVSQGHEAPGLGPVAVQGRPARHHAGEDQPDSDHRRNGAESGSPSPAESARPLPAAGDEADGDEDRAGCEEAAGPMPRRPSQPGPRARPARASNSSRIVVRR
jgi:hypothetical protein